MTVTGAAEMSTGQFSMRRPDQLMVIPKVECLEYSITVLHVVKLIFRNVKSCKHYMHEKYAE